MLLRRGLRDGDDVAWLTQYVLMNACVDRCNDPETYAQVIIEAFGDFVSVPRQRALTLKGVQKFLEFDASNQDPDIYDKILYMKAAIVVAFAISNPTLDIVTSSSMRNLVRISLWISPTGCIV